MNIIALPLVLAVLIFWVYAEFKLRYQARIVAGIMAILCGGFLVYDLCQVKSFYENSWYRSSIRDAENLLKQGQTNIVISAFETYNNIAVTNSTFQASEQMMHILRSGETD